MDNTHIWEIDMAQLGADTGIQLEIFRGAISIQRRACFLDRYAAKRLTLIQKMLPFVFFFL